MKNLLGSPNKLKQFRSKSASALNIFTETVNNLKSLSKEIEKEKIDTVKLIKEKEIYVENLENEKNNAENIINKIASILK